MDQFMEGVMPAVMQLATTVVAVLCGYVAVKIKAFASKNIQTQEKADVAWHTVQYVEQVVKDLHGAEKLDFALKEAGKVLEEKGIPIGETELRMLIESAVNAMNKEFKSE